VVLAVSLLLGAVSLMGLSRAGREQSGYQALDRAAVMGVGEEPRPPGGPEEEQQQQTQVADSPAGSINSGIPHLSESIHPHSRIENLTSNQIVVHVCVSRPAQLLSSAADTGHDSQHAEGALQQHR